MDFITWKMKAVTVFVFSGQGWRTGRYQFSIGRLENIGVSKVSKLPLSAHDFAWQSVVCYTLCRHCCEKAVAHGSGVYGNSRLSQRDRSSGQPVLSIEIDGKPFWGLPVLITYLLSSFFQI